MAVEVFDREREPMVDADDGRHVRREFLAKPFGETPPRPISPWARRRPNLFRCAGDIGRVDAKPLATGFSLAEVVDADVACKLGHSILMRSIAFPHLTVEFSGDF